MKDNGKMRALLSYWHKKFLWGMIGLLAAGNILAQNRIPMTPEAADAAFGRKAVCRPLPETQLLSHPEEEFLYAVGKRYATAIAVEQEAETVLTAEGMRLYRIGFESPGATFMDLSFDRFHLPAGSHALLYHPESRLCKGPYLPEEIHDSLGFSTDLLPGDRIVLLCAVPAASADSLRIALRCVIAGTQSFFNSGETPSCLINTACEEAAPYHDLVQSVVLIYMDGYLCSGTLLNNTAQDGTPYILTAAHCMEEIAYPRYGSWKFYFNIASRSCVSNSNGPTLNDLDLQSMTGCQLVAKGENSDFLLLKLNRKVPEGFNAYYSGWDRRNQAAQHGVAGIHHPKGDYKKISLSSQVPVTDNCAGVGFNRKAFWRFFWTQGMAFQGSSGSGLFDSQSKRLVGTLTAINDVTCESSVDRRLCWYGKLSYHWFANNESDSSKQLRPWLDPLQSGVLYLEGSYLRSLAQPGPTEAEPPLRLYPNPAAEELTLLWQEECGGAAEICSISGQRLLQFPLQPGENRIAIGQLAAGIYLLRAGSAQSSCCLRFTVIRP